MTTMTGSKDMLMRARYFATAAHAAVGHKRKYTGEDYIVHPIEVMELLATVHWVVSKDGASNLKDTIAAVQSWSDRKRDLFSVKHIELAWNVLHQRNLLTN